MQWAHHWEPAGVAARSPWGDVTKFRRGPARLRTSAYATVTPHPTPLHAPPTVHCPVSACTVVDCESLPRSTVQTPASPCAGVPCVTLPQAPGPSGVGQLCALPCGVCQQQDLCIPPRPMAKRCVQAAAELMDGCFHVRLLTASHGLKHWDQGSQRHRRGAIWSCGSAACSLPPSMTGSHASCLQLRESDVHMPRPHCEVGCYSIVCFGLLSQLSGRDSCVCGLVCSSTLHISVSPVMPGVVVSVCVVWA